MTSAIRLILGVSVLAFAVGSAGCSSSDNTSPTVVPPGGSGNTNPGTGGTSAGGTVAGAGAGAGGTGVTTGGTGAGGGSSVAGVPLTPLMGWVDGMSNTLGIQGAFFTYADPTTTPSLMSDTMSSAKICMSGTAAKVDLTCTPPAGMDCYGVTWGAAIGFNLNQPNDPTTMMGGTPAPYDASAVKGFAFDVGPGADGTATIPLPAQFRFNIEDATTQYCTPTAKGVKLGSNSYSFTDVEAKCYATVPGPTAATIQKGVVKISWQVVTNTTSTVPFDFCISNLVALQ